MVGKLTDRGLKLLRRLVEYGPVPCSPQHRAAKELRTAGYGEFDGIAGTFTRWLVPTVAGRAALEAKED